MGTHKRRMRWWVIIGGGVCLRVYVHLCDCGMQLKVNVIFGI